MGLDMKLANEFMIEHKREFAQNVRPVIQAVVEDMAKRGRKHGYEAVARELNWLKIRSYRGGDWSATTVRRVLLGPAEG